MPHRTCCPRSAPPLSGMNVELLTDVRAVPHTGSQSTTDLTWMQKSCSARRVVGRTTRHQTKEMRSERPHLHGHDPRRSVRRAHAGVIRLRSMRVDAVARVGRRSPTNADRLVQPVPASRLLARTTSGRRARSLAHATTCRRGTSARFACPTPWTRAGRRRAGDDSEARGGSGGAHGPGAGGLCVHVARGTGQVRVDVMARRRDEDPK